MYLLAVGRQAMVPRISFTGSFENHYEVDPSLFESILLLPQTTVERELVGNI